MPTTFWFLSLVLQVSQPASLDSSVLKVGNRPIAVLHGLLGAATPEERVEAAGRRIEAAILAGNDSVTMEPAPQGVRFLIGDRAVFILTPLDVDTARGISLDTAAQQTARALRLALRESREARSVRSLLRGAGWTLLATLLAAVVIRLLILGRRRTHGRLRANATVGRRISIRGYPLVDPNTIRRIAAGAVTVAAWGIGLVAGYLYLTFVLGQFPWTRPWSEALGRFLWLTLRGLGASVLGALPNLFMVVLIYAGARLATRFIRTVSDAAERGRVALPGVHPETLLPTRRIAITLVWLFAVIMAYPYIPGSDSAAFRGVSVLAGLLVTLGSTGLVGQAMSGLVLMYARSFKAGDYITAAGVEGTVLEVGMLSTRLRTPMNETVTLPNSVVIGNAVTDYSVTGSGPVLVHTSVTIGYDVPWRRVHQLLITAANRSGRFLAEPAPFVYQRALDGSYVEYQINAPMDPSRASQLLEIYSDLYGSIQDTFWEAGVEIMSPTYYAVRDGTTVTIPEAQRPRTPRSPFHVDLVQGGSQTNGRRAGDPKVS